MATHEVLQPMNPFEVLRLNGDMTLMLLTSERNRCGYINSMCNQLSWLVEISSTRKFL